MSGTFSIAAVTAVLKDLLNNGLADHDLSSVGNVAISALPPDRIPATNADEKSQINLFMYQATPNAGWSNMDLPSRGSNGERLTNAPLALDLRYLVTAYGEKEFHSEVLLGYAMQLLHENPVLTRAMINATLQPALPPEVTLPPGLAMLSTAGLAEQIEAIKITPYYLNAEEMSRFWAAMQAKYRPTAVYQVTVVLMRAEKSTKTGLPVLTQGPDDKGPVGRGGIVPPYPAIDSMTLPANQTEALLGDTVQLAGHDLAGDTGRPVDVTLVVNLINSVLPAPIQIVVPIAQRSATGISFAVPNTPAAIPAGVYTLSAVITPVAGTPDDARSTKEIVFPIAPVITLPLAPVARGAVDPITLLGSAKVALTCAPDVLPKQRVSLVLGNKESQADAHTAQTNSLSFVFNDMPAGTFRLRLRVDGAESFLVDRGDPKLLKFDDAQSIKLT